ncbi:hypothetical protein BC833DRAFT_650857 [Globomyces pollinis-pini]|nr:hypothetical protein BC833DRAFT_650857 [Globomyces pollinis-pini]
MTELLNVLNVKKSNRIHAEDMNGLETYDTKLGSTKLQTRRNTYQNSLNSQRPTINAINSKLIASADRLTSVYHLSFSQRCRNFISSSIDTVTNQYQKRVNYSQETCIFLILLLPMIWIIIRLLLLDDNIFDSKDSHSTLRLIAIISAIIAVWFCNLVNYRLSELLHIVRVFKGRASVQTIALGAMGNNRNQMARLSSICFFIFFLINMLWLQIIPVSTEQGQGDIESIVLGVNSTALDDYEVFYHAIGVEHSCTNCSGLTISESSILLPIVLDLVSTDTLSEEITITVEDDMIHINSQCLETLPSNPASSNQINMTIVDIVMSNASTLVVLDVYSTTSTRCFVTLSDYSGTVTLRYNRSVEGNKMKRINIDSIKSVNSTSENDCAPVGQYCLGRSARENLSHTLISFALGNRKEYIISNIYIDQQMFPNQLDALFELEISNFFSLLLQSASFHFKDKSKSKTVSIYTDQVAIKISQLVWSKYLTVGLGLITVLTLTISILLNLIRLNRYPAFVIGKVACTLKPGRAMFLSLSDYIAKMDTADHLETSWHLQPLKFGEDKKTLTKAIGRLKYDNATEVTYPKPRRQYI